MPVIGVDCTVMVIFAPGAAVPDKVGGLLLLEILLKLTGLLEVPPPEAVVGVAVGEARVGVGVLVGSPAD